MVEILQHLTENNLVAPLLTVASVSILTYISVAVLGVESFKEKKARYIKIKKNN